uniref:Uncharacterized protein n=1 Tax=Klebsiella phage vB_KpnP_P184 TaxID=2806547 RepID=A0A898K9T9_9CAUD
MALNLKAYQALASYGLALIQGLDVVEAMGV